MGHVQRDIGAQERRSERCFIVSAAISCSLCKSLCVMEALQLLIHNAIFWDNKGRSCNGWEALC